MIIKAENLFKRYIYKAETINAVNGVGLEVKQGEFISMMGPSGSGKTTLLDLIGCLTSLSEGRLVVLGEDVSSYKENKLVKIRRGKIGFIFQEFFLIPTLTALENVELAMMFARMKTDRKKAKDLLVKVGLEHRIGHYPKQMSGGEKQRVAVARSLAASPEILLADEPTGNLDTRTSQEIFSLFTRLNKQDGLTIIMCTHDFKLGMQAQRMVFLKDGKIVTKDQSGFFSFS